VLSPNNGEEIGHGDQTCRTGNQKPRKHPGIEAGNGTGPVAAANSRTESLRCRGNKKETKRATNRIKNRIFHSNLKHYYNQSIEDIVLHLC
jgi:hypothetical protein